MLIPMILNIIVIIANNMKKLIIPKIVYKILCFNDAGEWFFALIKLKIFRLKIERTHGMKFRINPPAKEKESYRDQGNDHDIFNESMKMITTTAGADLIHTEPYVN